MGDTLPMSRATIVVRPGWNEAAHIDAEILHAVAYYKFKTHVEGLLQRGLRSSGCGRRCARLTTSPLIFGSGGTSLFQTVTLHGREL